jgi:O-methyltransferase
MRKLFKSILAVLLRPYASSTALPQWNYWLGRIYNIKLPGKVKAFSEPTTGCSANINIVMDLLNRTDAVAGDIAECGVFQGATLVPVTNTLNSRKDTRQIYGFDSFEGFGKAAEVESAVDASGHIDLETEMFQQTSVGLIREKLKLTHTNTDRLNLVKGYFENSLPAYSNHTYSFVHLDCDLASSYLTCLSFFYPRLNKGGIILFDEYLDPVYTAATETIDQFFADKSEKPLRIEHDNYVKYYILKN